MTDYDPDDLFADPPPKPDRAAARAERRAQAEAAKLPPALTFRKPVGVTFLADIVGKQPKQIQKRLEKCPVVSWEKHGQTSHPLYNFLEAMSYLVPPKGDIEDWFAQQNQASLPPNVSKAFWDMANQRERALLAAGDLWHTDDVLAVLSRVSMTIRQTSKMWIEDMPGKHMLTDEQYQFLMDQIADLGNEVKRALEDMPNQARTLAHSESIREELDGVKISTVNDE